jgi:hypothetical protein
MNITEEQKQEADRIVEKYLPKDFFGDSVEMRNATKCAIQDRRSVLYKVTKMKFKIDPIIHTSAHTEFNKQIQSLANQISYLKSKQINNGSNRT